jgi:hypothetical protein
MALARFGSITGISMSSAEAGETVKISYRSNCKDELPGLNKFAISRDMLENLVYPELLRRIKKRSLSTNFRLRKAHIIFFSKESKNQILLNGRTRFLIKIKLKAGVSTNQAIRENDVEDVLGIYPSKQNDPNAAHIMLFKFKGDWLISYDFNYNSSKARKHIEAARIQIKKSEESLKQEDIRLFIKEQFQAAKLLVSSILVLNNSKMSFKSNPSHLSDVFGLYAKTGNIDVKFSNFFNELKYLNGKDRIYMQGRISHYEDRSNMLNLSKELMAYADNKLKSIEYYRNPPSGIYIK